MKRFIITFLLLVTTTFMFAEDKGWYNTQEATIAETEPGSQVSKILSYDFLRHVTAGSSVA